MLISVLPQSSKLRSSRDFTVIVRRGHRIGRETLVLHIRDTTASGGEDKIDMQITKFGGPRIGLVVSRAVGSAVTHHAISRKLRHVMAAAAQDPPSITDIVVRALLASATVTSQGLPHDVQLALATCRRRRQFAWQRPPRPGPRRTCD